MIEKRAIENCKCKLTELELKQAGEELARATRDVIAANTDKKAAAAAYKSRVESAEATCAQLSLKITQGYEMRDLECIVYYSSPKSGYKQIIRPDTGEVVREEPMTADEMQAGFNFDEGSKPQ